MSRANQLADFHRQLQEITGDLTELGASLMGGLQRHRGDA